MDALGKADLVTMFYEEQEVGAFLSDSPAISLGYDHLPSHDFVMVRRFPNWLASVRRHPRGLGGEVNESILQTAILLRTIYFLKIHAARALGRHPDANSSLTPVVFDRWLVEPDYREMTLRNAGLALRDHALPIEVSRFGGGSSFTAGEKTPAAEDLLQRWRTLEGDETAADAIKLALRDEELTNLVREIEPEDFQILRRLAG